MRVQLLPVVNELEVGRELGPDGTGHLGQRAKVLHVGVVGHCDRVGGICGQPDGDSHTNKCGASVLR